MHARRLRSARARGAAVTAAAVAALAVTAGCGSSSGGAAAAPASSGSAGGNYAALLKKIEQPAPSSFGGPATPAKAPAGIKIATISSDQTLEGDANVAAAVSQAAASIGWQARTFNGQGSTTTQNTVIGNAVSWGAKVIVLDAVNPVTVQTGLAAAKKAGAIIVGADGATGGFSPNPVIKPPAGDVWPATEVSVDNGAIGKGMAQWIEAQSSGTAKTLILGDKEFSGSVIGPEGMETVLKGCSGCTTSPIMWFVAADIASSLGPQVVSYVHNHPGTDYVSVPYDPAVPAVVTALQNAGLASQVKIVSNLGDQQNLNDIQNGTVQSADFAWDATYIGYATVDQSIRLLDKMPVFSPAGENVPYVVLTRGNLGDSATQKAGWTAAYDYPAKFRALWKG